MGRTLDEACENLKGIVKMIIEAKREPVRLEIWLDAIREELPAVTE